MRSLIRLAGLCLATASTAMMCAQTGEGGLAKGFKTPPASAQPRTWWHWTNGNVTEEGITKDLEWMKRSGIGGFQLADVSAGGGQTVEKKIHFGTPEWYHAVHHTAMEAKRLGLEMTIFSSPGWSEAGGPWVKPEQAMKRLVWSETAVEGGKQVNVKLAEPPSNQGPVRDLIAGAKPDAPHFYRDSIVIAYRTPEAALQATQAAPKASTNAGPLDATALLDGSLNTSVVLRPVKAGEAVWMQYEFPAPFTARALTLGARSRIPVGTLCASSDGINFHEVVRFPGPQGYHGAAVRTFAFPAVTARFFRIQLDGAGFTPAEVIHGGVPQPAAQYTLTEAILSPDARVNRWEDKAAFGSLMDNYEVAPTRRATSDAVIATKDVVDLTGKMEADGTLNWQAPEGHWTVLRMGYALTGAMNRPSVPAGSGLEVDKLDAAAVRSYFHGYMEPIQKELGPLAGTTLTHMMMDSWEAGMQNWTPAMLSQFKTRRHYDPTPWLPVLTGHVVRSPEASDRFLWDFRQTLAEMFASEFYETMMDELHKAGMKGYAEASGVALEIPEDTLMNKRSIDIPMGEFWVHALHPESMYFVDIRGAASAAHVWGRPVVAAEAFTGGSYESPATLKKIADFWFAQGVNRLVFHTSAQQPLDTKPGNTMVGAHINRNITWAGQARGLMDYFSRVEWMLQQGSPVADVAVLLPEGGPSTMPFWGIGMQPYIPDGFDYDYVNADLMLHHTSVTADGRIRVEGSAEMPDGMSYRALMLPESARMTPELAAKLVELVTAGATIVGPRPYNSPTLSEAATSDDKMQESAELLWADMDGMTYTQHATGKGMTYWGQSLDEIMSRLKLQPDFQSSRGLGRAPAWIHRSTPDAEIYFIANQTDEPAQLDARFRVAGRTAELWRPLTGARTRLTVTETALVEDRSGNKQPGLEPAAYVAANGLSTIALNLEAREAVFVVFPKTADAQLAAEKPRTTLQLAKLSGPWTVSFPPHWGAPASIQLNKLAPWTDNANEGVRYFSGTAAYTKEITVDVAWLKKGRRIMLDLGQVRDLAEVVLNGKPCGTVWTAPFRVDVTDALKAGSNRLEIRITNEWTNRIVGDRKVAAENRVIPAENLPPAMGQFGGPQEPQTAGLLGPVRLVTTLPEPANR